MIIIQTPKQLSEMMAEKAKVLYYTIIDAIEKDQYNKIDSPIIKQYNSFKGILNKITIQEFADVYAQIVVYGIFASRIQFHSLLIESRQDLSKLTLHSNPFLRRLFDCIYGDNLDDRIKPIIESVIQGFLDCNIDAILKEYGKSTKMEDPIIHFYETFLSEYNPIIRKSRGVWYTPKPIVTFIVNAVDYIIRTQFELNGGICDTAKTYAISDDGKEKEIHRVQLLDLALGTGTFVIELIRHIHKKFTEGADLWQDYVEKDLIPRLNGFEILMTSYAMAHLKISLLLKETGYAYSRNQELNICLKNSLDNPNNNPISNWIIKESNETPIICIMGNPPYSGSSLNMSDWIVRLIEDYKDETEKKRRGRRWVQDDYVKFIRQSQYFIEKNKSGVLAFINPHGFLDNPTFKGMRLNLLKTFDTIYVIDLHGNTKKKEITPDGMPDENVFDIQQGVSINIFIKTGKKLPNELAKCFHTDVYGQRKDKYDFLLNNSIDTIEFTELTPNSPNYFFVPKNEIGRELYESYFKIDELFKLSSTGVVTGIDGLAIHQSIKELTDITNKILESSNPEIEFNIKDSLQSSKEERIEELKVASNESFTKISYRPFDTRYLFYTKRTHGWLNSPRFNIMQHFLKKDNIGLALCKQFKTGENYHHAFISNQMLESSFVSNKTSEITSTFPLYLYSEQKERLPNLNPTIVNKISKTLGLRFTNEKQEIKDTFAPIHILDYIYAILHSPIYRQKYKEFLKIDFPRIPYPKDIQTFFSLVEKGSEIRRLHLLEHQMFETLTNTYSVKGSNNVKKVIWNDNKVYINETQYFENIPKSVFDFYIGGYQPAQKWLKDRKNKTLNDKDILHYQKIILSLNETHRIMKEIEQIDIE